MPGVQKREIPTCIENEEALLGAILSNADMVLPMVTEFVTVDDFYNASNKTIFEACMRLYDNHQNIDMLTVEEQLGKMKKSEAVGGLEYLSTLLNGMYICANAEAYAKAIAEKATERNLIEMGEKIVNEAYEGSRDLDDLLALAQDGMMNVAKRQGGKTWQPVEEIIPDLFDDLEASAGKNGITGLPTGFVDLDKITKGLHEADLVYVGARPGMGKTAFLLDIARYLAVKKNIPVAVFNLEMSKKQMAMRLLSAQANVVNEKLSSGNLSPADWSDLARASNELANVPLYIDDVIDATIENIRAKCRKLQKEKGIQLVLIDYLQLVTSARKRSGSANRQEEVSDISRTLKMMARELGIPVVVGCQLSRQLESRDDKRPILSDLRESGTLEQDADIVLFLYREVRYNKETEYPNLAELIMGKHRNGKCETIKLLYDADHTSFKNMSKRGE